MKSASVKRPPSTPSAWSRLLTPGLLAAALLGACAPAVQVTRPPVTVSVSDPATLTRLAPATLVLRNSAPAPLRDAVITLEGVRAASGGQDIRCREVAAQRFECRVPDLLPQMPGLTDGVWVRYDGVLSGASVTFTRDQPMSDQQYVKILLQ
ncbi:hypothetical protein [Deinococcus aquiradiocola]|uniref:Lipoprotein n=1 Tax=Deinococcus aquiradiocola TaxID=393059 RepID=A0A917UQC1_9DEIO|nr:hypothetical protein [Deinococcus aquiradiocola]GGJ76481.1 hypothetical protein GCM10008939_20840 [Deinococcus aquiradiocola]